MRERGKSYSERTSVLDTDIPLRRYFLVYEGTETEPIYFEAVEKNKRKIGIAPFITLVPLVRDYSEGSNNPKRLVEYILKTLEHQESKTVSYQMLIDEMVERYNENCPNASKKQIGDELKIICRDVLHVQPEDVVDSVESECESLLKELSARIMVKGNPDGIREVKLLDYQDNLDKICFIVDRDAGNFSQVGTNGENQYEEALSICQDNKFGFYVTNPNFEFWLLMHFDNVDALDPEELLANKKVKGKTYTLRELCKRLPKFGKSEYDPCFFMDKIDTAIENEKKYCENIGEWKEPDSGIKELKKPNLKENIGSNVGTLITEMRENRR